MSRVYQVSGLHEPTTMNFISITHCNEGTVDFAKTIPISSLVDIDWNRPFCMLKPTLGDRYPYKDNDRVGREKVSDANTDEHHNTDSNKFVDYSIADSDIVDCSNPDSKTAVEYSNTYIDIPTSSTVPSSVSPSTSTFLSRTTDLLKKLIYYHFDKKMESTTRGHFVEYTGRTKLKHLLDIQSADPHRALSWESRNLVCYKMARRRKYARSNLTFFVPNTFVGALFECPVPQEIRAQVIQNLDTSDFLKLLDFRCDPSIARPVLALIADVPLNTWSKIHLSHRFRPSISITVPYMSTRLPLDLRFRNNETPDMFAHTWAARIDVNEDYDYSTPDLDFISQALALSSNYVNHLVALPDVNSNCTGSFGKITADITESPNSSAQYLRDIYPRLSLAERIALVFSKWDDTKIFNSHLRVLQGFWDVMEL